MCFSLRFSLAVLLFFAVACFPAVPVISQISGISQFPSVRTLGMADMGGAYIDRTPYPLNPALLALSSKGSGVSLYLYPSATEVSHVSGPTTSLNSVGGTINFKGWEYYGSHRLGAGAAFCYTDHHRTSPGSYFYPLSNTLDTYLKTYNFVLSVCYTGAVEIGVGQTYRYIDYRFKRDSVNSSNHWSTVDLGIIISKTIGLTPAATDRNPEEVLILRPSIGFVYHNIGWNDDRRLELLDPAGKDMRLSFSLSYVDNSRIPAPMVLTPMFEYEWRTGKGDDVIHVGGEVGYFETLYLRAGIAGLRFSKTLAGGLHGATGTDWTGAWGFTLSTRGLSQFLRRRTFADFEAHGGMLAHASVEFDFARQTEDLIFMSLTANYEL